MLGRGSNVVVSDRGVRGLVVHVRAEQSRVDGDRYVAAAGVPMARAATETQKAGLSGLEFGLAIPGTVGGAVWANAGAHGSDVAAVLESADVLRADGTEARVPAAELGLAYRDSRFKHQEDPATREIILGATFHLVPGAGRGDPRAPRRHPTLAAGPPAAGGPVGRQRLPQPGRTAPPPAS